MSPPMPDAPKNKASTSNDQDDAGLQATGDVAASTTTASRSSTRQSTAAPVAGQRELRSSSAASSALADNTSSSSRSATPKKRITFYSIVNPSKKKTEKRSESSKEEEEEEVEDKPSTSRDLRPKRSTSTAYTKNLLDHVKKLSHEIEKRKRSASVDPKGAKKRIRGESSDDLEEALAETLLVKPYFVDFKQGEDGASSNESNEAPKEPVKVLRSEDLPGISIWTETSYADSGFDKKTGKVEMFTDREVEKIVAYVLHNPDPFVLIKLAQKRNEKTVRVKDVVQAVDCALANLLFKKTFKAFMTRMGSGSKEKTDEDSEKATEAETEDGPSASMTPSGRSRRGNKN